MGKILSAAMMLALMLTSAQAPAQAVALKLLVGGAMAEAAKTVGDGYAQATGNRLDTRMDTTGALQQALRAGGNADVIILSAAGMDQLQAEHLIMAGTRINLARALIGVSARAGATPPDISTVEAFRRALLAARTIAYVDPKAGGTSGIYLDGLFRKMGIAEDLRKKTLFANGGAAVAALVARGDAELGLTFVSEMMPNKGVRIAGTLPPDIQSATIYAVAIPAASKHADAARDFVKALTSAKGHAAMKSAGLEPIEAY